MSMGNFTNGFSSGLLLRNVPIEDPIPGKAIWVGNNATRLSGESTAADGNEGSFLPPCSTITGV